MNRWGLNNKGFAITSILYTLFILFLLIFMSVLIGLTSRKNFLEKSVMSLEDSFTGEKSDNYIQFVNENQFAPVDGKYIFELDDNTNKTICSTYLTKNTNIKKETMVFIPNDCNEYDYVLNFGTEDDDHYNMTLKEVYSFEKE